MDLSPNKECSLKLLFLLIIAIIGIHLNIFAQEATVSNITLEFNVEINDMVGLKINFDATAEGFQGETLRFRVCLDSPANTGWMDINGNCRDSNGVVSTYLDLPVDYSSQWWKGNWIFISNEELHLAPEKRTYAVHICVVTPNNDNPNNAFAWSDFAYFDGWGGSNSTGNRPPSYSGSNVYTPAVPYNQNNYNQNKPTDYNKYEATCMGCNGTGICAYCKGTGTTKYGKCGRCHGTGRCASCAGLGKKHGIF